MITILVIIVGILVGFIGKAFIDYRSLMNKQSTRRTNLILKDFLSPRYQYSLEDIRKKEILFNLLQQSKLDVMLNDKGHLVVKNIMIKDKKVLQEVMIKMMDVLDTTPSLTFRQKYIN